IRLESYGLSSIFTLAFFPFSCCTAPHADSSLPTRRSSDLALLTTIDQARRPVLLVHRNLPEKRTHGYPLLTSGELIDLCVHTPRSEEHTSELQSRFDVVCRLLLVNNNNLR